jgi:hypothetical protein
VQILDCPIPMECSPSRSQIRIEKARLILGRNVVNRVLGFALFLLGAKREEIARLLGIPYGTFLSFLSRADKLGVAAFQDRRRKAGDQATAPRPPTTATAEVSVRQRGGDTIVSLSGVGPELVLPRSDPFRRKVVLLGFVIDGLLSPKAVADVLGYSPRHVRHLARKMAEGGAEDLVDQRKGQLCDYRYTSEVKSEIVLQFAVNAMTGRPTSSRVLTRDINERRDLGLADRSVRWHLDRLGLAMIAAALPSLVENLKRGSNR